jgi:hypothetical protein
MSKGYLYDTCVSLQYYDQVIVTLARNLFGSIYTVYRRNSLLGHQI